MQFGTLTFWLAFLFFFVFFLGVRWNVRARNIFLLGASWFFVAWWDGTLVLLLMGVTLVGFCTGLLLPRMHRKKFLLIPSIALQLGVLAFCKYAGFFAVNLQRMFSAAGLHADWPTLHLLLPLGISFYTFQSIGYCIDVYRRRQESCRDPVAFGLFLAFFPKFLAGPIERASAFLPQLARKQPVTSANLLEGSFLLLWGMVQKFCIAENAAWIADQLFTHPGQAHFFAFSAPLAFTLQIYTDFSGYSDIAAGLALLLGFRLSRNFLRPSFATSPGNFWRRWHITLSEWFRDYVYIPLGGNRKGAWITSRNLLLTMALAGLWHGAQWTFVLWGFYHGMLLVLYRLLPAPKASMPSRTGRLLSGICFFALVVFGWLLFRSSSVYQFAFILQSMASAIIDGPSDVYLRYVILLWLPVLLMDAVQALQTTQDRTIITHVPLPVRIMLAYIMIYAIIFVPPALTHDFIYIQF